MTVELVPNRDKYEDVYPSDDESEDEETSEDSESEMENETTRSIEKEKREMEAEMAEVEVEFAAAKSQINMLANYSRSIERNRPSDMRACLDLYKEEGSKAETTLNTCKVKADELKKEHKKLVKKLSKAHDVLAKEKAKRDKVKFKAAEKKRRIRQDKLDAKRRLKEERSQFWPKKTFCVVVSLEAGWDTPATSRRGSVESLPTVKQASTSSDSGQVSLSLSYITHSAYWTPRYDLSLNTPSASGTIVYRSEYCNTTSETWKDARVSLSTSETSFSGVSDQIPTMWPWNIRLAKKGFAQASDALVSTQEQGQKQQQVAAWHRAQEPRHVLFGLDGYAGPPHFQQAQAQNQNHYRSGGLFGSKAESNVRPSAFAKSAAVPPPPGGSHFGNTNNAGFGASNANSLFGSNANQATLFGGAGTNNAIPPAFSRAAPRRRDHQPDSVTPESEVQDYTGGESLAAEGMASGGGDEATLLPDLPSLTTEEATWAEEGLTFTYEIPNLRTIGPSFTKRRFRIASIHLSKISLSYVLVPKLRTAAFLKARLHNSSTVTLLRGLAGITLDGSFLGNANLPRCSAGESFPLSLGVDPSVHVTYAKPAVKRSSTGMFQKDDTAIYSRSCTIMNTKPNRLIEGIYLDQVPVSQDERLKTSIVKPVGLGEDGSARSDGRGLTRDGKDELAGDKRWGKATASLKAKGEVRWDFKIEPSRGAKFVLEYETRHPGGETVVGA